MSEKVLILGLSKSGIAAAKFAASKGYDVYITESKGVNEAGRLDNPATPQGIKGVNDIREEYRQVSALPAQVRTVRSSRSQNYAPWLLPLRFYPFEEQRSPPHRILCRCSS